VSFEEAERVRALEQKLARSAEVECAICLECVLEKQRLGDRRFGLLSGCDHAFCLQCIRDWRDGGVAREAPEAQTSSALEQARRCPICREQSHFITPSQYWPKDAAEKAATIAVYQGKMKKIPCRNFDYGDGSLSLRELVLLQARVQGRHGGEPRRAEDHGRGGEPAHRVGGASLGFLRHGAGEKGDAQRVRVDGVATHCEEQRKESN
jgi:hypothetical protein